MLTKDFDFYLPEDRIARYPTPNRTDSRLLNLDRGTGAVLDCQFSDLITMINPGDLLVLNDTKVMPARLFGRKETGGKIELLIERIVSDNQAWVQIRASKVPKPGTWLVIAEQLRVQVRDYDLARGMFLVSFHHDEPISKILEMYGEIPLPPYMQRGAEREDSDRYQTIYADPLGSVAAPTAGLHFSQALLFSLQNKGVDVGRLTLHVGAGTFQPVRVDELSQHKMHSEHMNISAQLCAQISATKARGGRVICVGTTTVRALESAALAGELHATSGDTDIFITPGFKFKVADALLTNFHLPISTLLMLVCAFATKEQIFAAYAHAIAQNYRFYSYGDAMFITGTKNEV